MIKNQRQNILKTLLLLALFVSYQASVTMFVHTHVVDGVAVAHSHPFTSSSHSHSSSQVVAIGQLSSFNGVECVACEDLKVYHNGVVIVEHNNQSVDVTNENTPFFSLRAPPVSC